MYDFSTGKEDGVDTLESLLMELPIRNIYKRNYGELWIVDIHSQGKVKNGYQKEGTLFECLKELKQQLKAKTKFYSLKKSQLGKS